MLYSNLKPKQNHLLDSAPVTVEMDSSEDTCLIFASPIQSMMDLHAKTTPFLFKQDTGGNGRTRPTKTSSNPLRTH